MLSPLIAAWLPTFAFALLAAILVFRTERV
jgi:lipopolysaccharide export LptBFGC system permease protein LptF